MNCNLAQQKTFQILQELNFWPPVGILPCSSLDTTLQVQNKMEQLNTQNNTLENSVNRNTNRMVVKNWTVHLEAMLA